MNTIASIVVGIDFTPSSAVALKEALRIAQWNLAAVRAVHVIDTLVAIELEDAVSEFQRDVRNGLMADATQAWNTFAAGIEGAANVPIDIRIDNRVRGILAAAKDASADLLVVGAFGVRVPQVGFGTVATACVRHSAMKVLLVRDTHPGRFKTIVACVDFSPTSLIALDQAASVAMQDDAALHVLHVFDAPWHQLHYRAPTPQAAPSFQRQYRHGLERRIANFANELGREINFLKPHFELFDYQGHRTGISEYAAKVGADLLVLGTRGRSNIRDMFLGSTAEKVLRDSKCSVLAVKPEISLHKDDPTLEPAFRNDLA